MENGIGVYLCISGNGDNLANHGNQGQVISIMASHSRIASTRQRTTVHFKSLSGHAYYPLNKNPGVADSGRPSSE